MFSVSDSFSAMFPGRDNPLEEKYPQKWHFIDKFLYFFYLPIFWNHVRYFFLFVICRNTIR